MLADLSKYKVVHKDKVIKALGVLDIRLAPYTPHEESVDGVEVSNSRVTPMDSLTLLVIDEDCTLGAITGKGSEFQFIPKLSP